MCIQQCLNAVRFWLSDFITPIYIEYISAQQKPEKSGAGSDREHDDDIVFETDIIDPVSGESRNGSHYKAQTD